MDHDIGQVLDLLDESVQFKVFEIAEVYEDFCEGLSYAIKEKFRLLDESVQLKVLEVINKKRKTLYHHFSFKSWLHNIWDDFTYDWMEGIGENFNSLSEFVQHKIIELVEKDNKLMLQKIGFADDYTQKYSDTVKLMYREGNTINIRERCRFCERVRA